MLFRLGCEPSEFKCLEVKQSKSLSVIESHRVAGAISTFESLPVSIKYPIVSREQISRIAAKSL